jgi:hypothetical protein
MKNSLQKHEYPMKNPWKTPMKNPLKTTLLMAIKLAKNQ